MPTPEQAISRLEERTQETRRRLERLEDQELPGHIELLSERIEQLTKELSTTKTTLGLQLAEVKGTGVWVVRSFVGLILTLLASLIFFILTTQ